jgi:hypothetical protein
MTVPTTHHGPTTAPGLFARRGNAALLAGIALVLAFACLYLFTLDDGLRPVELAGGDLITHQYAQVQGRFSNAPGYPLYTMGGWLWFHLGRGLLGGNANPIPLLSSYSTLWALVSLALLYALILESAGGRKRWPVALLVSAFYGFTYFFWYYAVTTEQYTSSVAWTLAYLLLAFRWERRRQEGYLLSLALLTGVGLAHQVTVLFVTPPVLWFVLSRDRGLLRRPRLMLAALALALLPLLSYAFVYIRGSQHPEWRGAGAWATAWAGDWQWFLSFISTRQGRSELTWSLRPFFTAEFPRLTWREMTLPGLLAGLAGIACLTRPRAITLSATLAIYAVFCWIDRLGNWFQVIMPAYALLCVGIAAGANWILEAGSSAFAGRARKLRYAAVLLALAALVVYRAVVSYPLADASRRRGDTALDPAWRILADEPPTGAAILGTQAEELALSYITEIWGRRPDLRPVTSDEARALLPDEGFAVTEAALPLVPLEVSPDARYSALGQTLAAVSLAPAGRLPAGLLPWQHDFGDGLRLAGGKLTRNAATGDTVVDLAWQPQAAPEHDWSISVRLLGPEGEIGQTDRANPVFGAYPTTRWLPGEVVMDAYPFALPAGAQPERVRVIVYRPANGGFINLGETEFALTK